MNVKQFPEWNTHKHKTWKTNIIQSYDQNDDFLTKTQLKKTIYFIRIWKNSDQNKWSDSL